MNIKKSIHMRVIIALEKGQKRIRCLESEFEEAARYGITDPTNSKRYIAAFKFFEDTKSGFFAYFNDAFMVAAMKTWHITSKEKETKK